MNEQKIDLLTAEATRLVEVSLELNDYVEKRIPLPDDSKLKNELTNNQAVLENEQQKLANNEMVLAVVGTMKAGKSTTINAIVGTEVLPNRNRPMTALPTLIRHKKGQRIPTLYSQNLNPITALCSELAQKLKEGIKPDATVDVDSDMKELLTQIQSGRAFSKEVYCGEEEIFQYLKGLNDLVRLASGMKSRFPYEDYKKIDQVPVIEVEFSHLSEFDNTKGQISILDTPGPNESEQPQLAKMLEEQLSKASAVVSVMDYTQLRSTADADVRRSIERIPNDLPLYVLVNKFDQKDRNGDDEQATKKMVSEQLMRGRVTESNVFPVSSMQAYLSNRAKRHIDVFGKLPEPDQEAWVEDFGEEAIGRKWRKVMDDLTEVKEAASELWEESLFSSPMSKVLHTAHANAAKFSIKSAVEKVNALADYFERELQLLSQGANKEIHVLKASADALQQDVEKLKDAEHAIKAEANRTISEAIKVTTESASKIQKSVDKGVDKYFKEGKKQELSKTKKKKKKAKKPQGEGRGLQSLFSSVFNKLGQWEPQVSESEEQDFNPNHSVIEFKERDDAKVLLTKIENSTRAILEDGQRQLEVVFSECLDNLDVALNSSIKESIEPIQKHIESELEEAGFKVALNLPSFSERALTLNVDTVFDSALEQKSKSETRQRRQSGAWGTVCSWFNTDDWGWEDYEVTVKYYHVDLNVIRKKTEEQVDTFINAINGTIRSTIQEPVNAEVGSFFEEFNRIVESVVSNLRTSISKNNLSKEDKLALVEELKLCLERNSKIKEYNAELAMELETDNE
ncbi:hypothetical protein J7I02_002962 [Vibrio parahaemolyticus]|nr:hypothetical protein [Vibrio parahaemolyticus]